MAKRKSKPPTRKEIISQSRLAKSAELVAMRNPPPREKVPGKIIIKTGREPSADFYASDAWRVARFSALRENDGCCELCGRSKRKHGVVLHVDHIRPRSKFPALALDKSNLQILCEDCNMGKGNSDDTDWRGQMTLEQLHDLSVRVSDAADRGEECALIPLPTIFAMIDGMKLHIRNFLVEE